MLIGQLLAVCDVSSGRGISGKEGDIFWLCSKGTQFKLKPCILSASPVEARPAHVWRSIKITWLLLFNRHSGPLLQLAFSNELIEIGCRILPFNVTGQSIPSKWTCGEICCTRLANHWCLYYCRVLVRNWRSVHSVRYLGFFPLYTHKETFNLPCCLHLLPWWREAQKWWSWGLLGPVSKLAMCGQHPNIPLAIFMPVLGILSSANWEHLSSRKAACSFSRPFPPCNVILAISELSRITAAIKAPLTAAWDFPKRNSTTEESASEFSLSTYDLFMRVNKAIRWGNLPSSSVFGSSLALSIPSQLITPGRWH